MTLPALSGGRVAAYLGRLGAPHVAHDADGLAALQTAHLTAVPFHNLLLLANDGRPWGLPPLERVVDDAIAGVGGNCDRTTPPFAALLQSLGFDVQLAAATVREPGDHFVSIVRIDGERFLADVGNGHPYLRPWRLDVGVQEQSAYGWRFRFEPGAPGGPRLVRHLPGGDSRTVYVVDPSPRSYEDFAPIVRAHYTEAAFGPFLGGLRAVRIRPEAVLTLRDSEYARDTAIGRSLRPIIGREATERLLVERFGLPPALIAEAMDVLARRRPDLFAPEPRWVALGRGTIEASADVARPARAAVPDVLVTLATVGPGLSVARLLDSLAAEVQESGYPGKVGVILVENHKRDQAQARGVDGVSSGLTVHRIHLDDVKAALARATRAGVLPHLGDVLPVPIGAAREAQLAVLRAHLAVPIHGLPHPNRHPTIVWMLDDDVAFLQLGRDGEARRRTNLLFRAARFWATLPQHAVVLGAFTGDPPVPALDSLGGQLHDLTENVARMLRLGPEARWEPPPAPPPRFDAYYDLTEADVPQEDAVWPYAPGSDAPVRDVSLALLRDLRRLLDGQQLTRPLVWDGDEAAPVASLRRGGNALFLDLDALFRWPTPVLAGADGVVTRRADSIWAALAQSEDAGAVVEATLPLLHGREGQAVEQPADVDPGRASAQCAAQVRGVVLARALAEGRDVRTELPAREARVRAHRVVLRARLVSLRDGIAKLACWDDPEVDVATTAAMRVLDALDHLAMCGVPRPGDADELAAFLSRLPGSVLAWREGWR